MAGLKRARAAASMDELFKMDGHQLAGVISALYRDEAGNLLPDMPWNIRVSVGFESDALCVPEDRCPDRAGTGKDGHRWRRGNCGWCRYFMGAKVRAEMNLSEETVACCGALLWAQKNLSPSPPPEARDA